MNDQDLIDKYFQQAVKNLKEEFFLNYELWDEYVSGLPEANKIVYLITVLHDQVFNGGFHQYFLNSYGMFSQETIVCLDKIGAKKTSALLSEVHGYVNYLKLDGPTFKKRVFDKNLDKIVNFDDELYDILDSKDDIYYDLDEDLEKLLSNYLSSIEN